MKFTHYALEQNYPNPFNPETEIRFQLSEESRIVLQVSNNLGKEVSTLVDADFSEGTHAVRWLAKDRLGRNLPSGVYHYRIQAGKFVATKKMNLLQQS